MSQPSQAIAPRPPLQAINKPTKALKIGKKLFHAIECMIFEGLELSDAAQAADMTTFALRQAFGRPHVIAHHKARREVLRAAASSKNILRLTQIRDAADNMPAVNAIKALEDLGSEQGGARGTSSSSPGIVIRIMAGGTTDSTTTIDAVANNPMDDD
jgi:hypothetical protein